MSGSAIEKLSHKLIRRAWGKASRDLSTPRKKRQMLKFKRRWLSAHYK